MVENWVAEEIEPTLLWASNTYSLASSLTTNKMKISGIIHNQGTGNMAMVGDYPFSFEGEIPQLNLPNGYKPTVEDIKNYWVPIAICEIKQPQYKYISYPSVYACINMGIDSRTEGKLNLAVLGNISPLDLQFNDYVTITSLEFLVEQE